jgi:hypothetical protein
MTYSNHVFSAFAFLGFLLCAIPFPWHLEGKYSIVLSASLAHIPPLQRGIQEPASTWHGLG